jgi:hypothetical protein
MPAVSHIVSRIQDHLIGALGSAAPFSFARSKYSQLDRYLTATTLDGAVTLVVLLIVGVGSAIAASASSLTIDLSRQQVGEPPRNFEFWRAGEADSEHWKVVREASADGGMSIQKSGADRGAKPSLAIYAPVSAVNGKVRARSKLIDGSKPSAGIAIRVTSPDNYYLVRASAYEQRVAVLHVINGAAEEIAGVDADITQDHWQTLEVVTRGNGFTISLNDQWVLTAFDYGKLTGGRFGIWTERDDVTRFDQIEIAPLT